MLDDILHASSIAEIFRDEYVAEGRAEGSLEAARKMARVALEGRFGALPDDLLAAIEAAREDALVAVVAHVTTDTLDEARARLAPEDGQ